MLYGPCPTRRGVAGGEIITCAWPMPGDVIGGIVVAPGGTVIVPAGVCCPMAGNPPVGDGGVTPAGGPGVVPAAAGAASVGCAAMSGGGPPRPRLCWDPM